MIYKIVLLTLWLISHSIEIAESFLMSTSYECIPIQIPQCKELGYNMTSSSGTEFMYDNIHTGKELIELVEKAACSEIAMFFLCSVYSPLCMKGITEPIKPCQSVCDVVKGKCERLLRLYGYSWPKELECENLPEHNTGVCIQPSALLTAKKAQNSRHPKSKQPENAPCAPCKKQKAPRFKNYRKADFVIEASIVSRETTAYGRTKIKVNVTKIFKKGQTKLTLGKLKLWAPTKCICPHFEFDTLYVIMGNEQILEKKTRLLFDDNTLLLSENFEIAKVKKWQEKCIKRECENKKKD